ncbi:MAG: hypothetical protein UT66_C0005G0025 [candidate division CPR2 bacterium GW2011_GWC1_39_9]|uniref:Lipoprotein n=1 Tax=candidate division CPR2 bacterium GW2011_GWC2_39_10 TaxID=1618345 RepID=A0A0G0LVM0_UNCC2|nr:MAG: hypothetical protein UT18_C0004G0029 [candidate division CPR2 bacterium GW2011_GWC2_39_10]KKR35989.1 MAG: hypothetical protein UT66_C0005G0025 [candidate division CPR2 bacterium GW2011_GWC1_39_9]
MSIKKIVSGLLVLVLLLGASLIITGCGELGTGAGILGRKTSRITGQEYVVNMPSQVQRIIWVDFTSGGFMTTKNVTFIDNVNEYYTLEINDLDIFQGIIHWLKPGSEEKESWTSKRGFTSRYNGRVTNIALPDDFKVMLSVSVKSNGTKDITYISNSGQNKSKEYKDLSPFDGSIIWSKTGGDTVEKFFFGRSLSRFTGKPIRIKVPDNFHKMVGVDFTESDENTIKNITFMATDERYYTTEIKDSGIFEGSIAWVATGKGNKFYQSRNLSRIGLGASEIGVPEDFKEMISVSIKPSGMKDLVYLSTDGQVKAQEYADFSMLQGRMIFKIEKQ